MSVCQYAICNMANLQNHILYLYRVIIYCKSILFYDIFYDLSNAVIFSLIGKGERIFLESHQQVL